MAGPSRARYLLTRFEVVVENLSLINFNVSIVLSLVLSVSLLISLIIVVNKISHFCSIIGGEVVNMEKSIGCTRKGPDRTLNIIGVVWLKRKS